MWTAGGVKVKQALGSPFGWKFPLPVGAAVRGNELCSGAEEARLDRRLRDAQDALRFVDRLFMKQPQFGDNAKMNGQPFDGAHKMRISLSDRKSVV